MRRKLCIVMALVMAFTLSFALTGCGDPEKEAAKEAFNTEVDRINSQIEERTAEIENARTLMDVKAKALDDTIKPALEKAANKAETDEVKIPDMPKETEDINAAAEELKGIDLTEQIDDLKSMEKALKKSRKQYKLLVNPEESFIKEKLEGAKNVENIAAVTEENDPNGNLNKPGGYTAQVYFSSPLVKDEYGILTGDSIEDGTDGGGSIEVYRTVSEANSRNDYLGSFDGAGALASGSHTVYGTIIIRTSSELTATQQRELEEEILEALTKLD